MTSQRQSEAIRQRDALARARRQRRRKAKPAKRSPHQWWLDVVARRLAANR